MITFTAAWAISLLALRTTRKLVVAFDATTDTANTEGANWETSVNDRVASGALDMGRSHN